MNILIVGGGKLGYYLAKTLTSEKHRMILIEEDFDLCKKIADELGEMHVKVIHGDGTDINYLKDAEINRMDILIATTGYDENNLFACQLAKNYFDVPRTIARVNNPKNINVFKRLGVDSVVSSTALIADIIELEVDWASLNNLFARRIGDVRIREIPVSQHSRSVGKKLSELKLPEETIIISMIRENQIIIPDGQTEIKTGDHVVVLTQAEKMTTLAEFFH